MKRRILIFVLAVALICILIIAFVGVDLLSKETQPKQPNVLVGVDVGYGDESDVYKVADAVQGYANLIIIGSLTVTNDTAKLTRVCDYIYQRGFSFIIYIGYGPVIPKGPDMQFFSTTAKQWGDKFLGAYIFDEPGGKQLDYGLGSPHYIDKPIKEAENYSDAAQQFVKDLYGFAINYAGPSYYDVPNLNVFTSDYGLYWFDYQSGYNAILGEFVGNQSQQQTIALCRGAANVQGKNWGTIITWKYTQPPYLENGTELYSDMVLAYNNDAKYIVVFDSPDNNTATSDIGLGILQQEHLTAMKQFWNYAISHPRVDGDPAQVAYVLPSDYGFGFRGPNDTIWGLFSANQDPATAKMATQIWTDSNSLTTQYGEKLDIVYETLTDSFNTRLMYDELIYWNGTIIGHP